MSSLPGAGCIRLLTSPGCDMGHQRGVGLCAQDTGTIELDQGCVMVCSALSATGVEVRSAGSVCLGAACNITCVNSTGSSGRDARAISSGGKGSKFCHSGGQLTLTISGGFAAKTGVHLAEEGAAQLDSGCKTAI